MRDLRHCDFEYADCELVEEPLVIPEAGKSVVLDKMMWTVAVGQMSTKDRAMKIEYVRGYGGA